MPIGVAEFEIDSGGFDCPELNTDYAELWPDVPPMRKLPANPLR